MDTLGDKIDQSDQILGELQEMLEDFEVKLSGMKSDMANLSKDTS